jgi:hypothetical protein
MGTMVFSAFTLNVPGAIGGMLMAMSAGSIPGGC